MLTTLFCLIFGHNLVLMRADYCDARHDDMHTRGCQQNLPIEVCARCWYEYRDGRTHDMD